MFAGIPALITGGLLFAIMRLIIHILDLRFGSKYAADYWLYFLVVLISVVVSAAAWYFTRALLKCYGKRVDDKNLLKKGQD